MSIINLTQPNDFDIYLHSIDSTLPELDIGMIEADRINIAPPGTPVFINGVLYNPGVPAGTPTVPNALAFFTGATTATLDDTGILMTTTNTPNDTMIFPNQGELYVDLIGAASGPGNIITLDDRVAVPNIPGTTTSSFMVMADAVTGELSTTASGINTIDPVDQFGLANNTATNTQLTLTGQKMCLMSATANFPGVVSVNAQDFLGDKHFLNDISTDQTVQLNDYTSPSAGCIHFGGEPYILNPGPGGGNVVIGKNHAITNPGIECTLLGDRTGSNMNSFAISNTASGAGALNQCTSGSGNCAYGVNTLNNGTTLSDCIAIGRNSGVSRLTCQNSIDIGNSGSNVSNEIRIGEIGIQNALYMAGVVSSASPTAFPMMYEPSNGKITRLNASPITSIITHDAFGVPNNAGMSIQAFGGAAQLCLNAYDVSNAGITTNLDQTCSGIKTFNDGVKYLTSGGASQTTLNYYEEFILPAFVPTQDVGTINTFTVRGIVSANFSNVRITRLGNKVTMTVPRWTVTSSTGVPTQFRLNCAIPARFRSNFDVASPAVCFNSGTSFFVAYANITIVTGNITFFPINLTNTFVTTYGIPNDLVLCWEVNN